MSGLSDGDLIAGDLQEWSAQHMVPQRMVVLHLRLRMLDGRDALVGVEMSAAMATDLADAIRWVEHPADGEPVPLLEDTKK